MPHRIGVRHPDAHAGTESRHDPNPDSIKRRSENQAQVIQRGAHSGSDIANTCRNSTVVSVLVEGPSAQRFRNHKDPADDGGEIKTIEEFRASERETRGSGEDVEADAGRKDPDRGREQACQQAAAGQDHHHRQTGKREEQEFRWPKPGHQQAGDRNAGKERKRSQYAANCRSG